MGLIEFQNSCDFAVVNRWMLVLFKVSIIGAAGPRGAPLVQTAAVR
jgi:hypothetical protein